MFHTSKSSSSLKNVRLPKQSSMPSYGDVQFLMQEAQKLKSRIVELPWSSPDRKEDFVLSVQCESEHAEPGWCLTQIKGGLSQLLWTYASRDLSLICNLVMTTSGAEQFQEVIPGASVMGDKAAGSQSSFTDTLSGPIIFEPPQPGAKATLEGDLKNLPVPSLLQSINLASMTGRLDVRNKVEQCEVFFQEGIPVHCTLKEASGDAALIELITWTSGEFRFWPDITTQCRSVNKRLDAVLMEGIALLDQSKYLDTAGLKLESCLVKKNAMISQEEFAQRLSKGAPLNIEQQLDFYELIDNRNTLFDLLRKCGTLNKAEWVPILFNLVSCGLVQITDSLPQQNRLATLKALGIEEAAVQGVVKNLVRQETGILTYPAFIYFLDQEYLRYEYFNLPFSLVVFSLGQRKGGGNGMVEALQMLAVRRAMQRISLIKRQVDLLGHYETFDYALLLPNTNSTAAGALANRIVDVLREAPLSSDMDSRSLACAFGVATVPEDCQELDKMLLSACKARDRAKKTNKQVVLAREILGQAALN